MGVWTVLVGAGAGSRFGGAKQFEMLGSSRVIDRALAAAAAVSDGVIVVLPATEAAARRSSFPPRAGRATVTTVPGGASRSQSVRAGIAAVPDAATIILVHDAARPLASVALFERVLAALHGGAEAVVPGVAVVDSLRHRAGGVVDRDALVAVQTPQGFHASALRQAHAPEPEASDDATLVEALGIEVVLVAGELANFKITTAQDLAFARAVTLPGR